MSIIDYNIFPQSFKDFLINQLDILSYTTCIFYEYLLEKRDGYIEFSKENIDHHYINPPVISSTMINYVIRHLLNIDYNVSFNFSIVKNNVIKSYLAKQNIDLKNISDYDDALFYINMTPDLKFKLKLFYKTDKDTSDVIYLDNDVNVQVSNYLNYFVNLILQDTDLSDIESINTNISNFYIKQGDNTFYPKDYNFIKEEQNIIVQSLVWLLCGICDWLEKDTITELDVTTINNILVPKNNRLTANKNFKDIQSKDLIDDIRSKLKIAVYLNNFIITDKALDKLTKLFFNLSDTTNVDMINRINYFSIII